MIEMRWVYTYFKPGENRTGLILADADTQLYQKLQYRTKEIVTVNPFSGLMLSQEDKWTDWKDVLHSGFID